MVGGVGIPQTAPQTTACGCGEGKGERSDSLQGRSTGPPARQHRSRQSCQTSLAQGRICEARGVSRSSLGRAWAHHFSPTEAGKEGESGCAAVGRE